MIKINLYTTKPKLKLSYRLRIMMGGRRILLLAFLSYLVQIPLSIYLYTVYVELNMSTALLIIDYSMTFFLTFSLVLNGITRIFYTSKYLRILNRIIFIIILWVPVINLAVALYFCSIVKKEYEHEYLKAELRDTREDTYICKTKYPIVMLHGIGFRDNKFLNYWGRIPKALKENGANIHYGNHHAWGTIESNAAEIKSEIMSIIKESNHKKVNIIAHSKGGLDARYLISELNMEDYVASLTTISSPHRGSELIDVLNKLKDKNYKKLANIINWHFRLIGDKKPNCYESSKQLQPSFMEEFNKKISDSPKVYYQSFMGIMNNFNTDGLLSIPFLVMKFSKGDNDGLVSIESSKWGIFKGYISNRNVALSHGDVIDLKRKNYDGFDITEEYIKIVSELKDNGY
ncbi:MAG: triacylglycerol lipase [Clostridiales bacterium]